MKTNDVNKLNKILNKIPLHVQQMYNIQVREYYTDYYKLYVMTPVWIGLEEYQIREIEFLTNYVKIRCEKICIILCTYEIDVQIIVY